MSFQTACGFIRLRGRDKLIWFREAFRAGGKGRQIAKELGISESRVSQVKKKLLKPDLTWREGAIDALQFEHAILLEDAATVKRNIEESLESQKGQGTGKTLSGS